MNNIYTIRSILSYGTPDDVINYCITNKENNIICNNFDFFNYLLRHDYDFIIKYCNIYDKIHNICVDQSFWVKKAYIEFNIDYNLYKSTNLNFIERYLEIASENGKIGIGSERYLHLNEIMKIAVHENKQYIIDHIFKLGFNKISDLIREYAYVGNIENFKYYYNNDYYKYFYLYIMKAINGKQIEMFDYILSVTPFTINNDLNYSLREAAYIGDKSFFNYIFTALYNRIDNIKWTVIARPAIIRNNLDLFEYIRSLAPSDDRFNWQILLSTAALSGSIDTFNYIMSNMSEIDVSKWNDILYNSVQSGDINLVNYILSLNKNWEINWTYLFYNSILSNNLNFIKFILTLAPSNISVFRDYQNYIDISAELGNLDIFKYILSILPVNYNIDWEFILEKLERAGKFQIFEHIRSIGISTIIESPLIE